MGLLVTPTVVEDKMKTNPSTTCDKSVPPPDAKALVGEALDDVALVIGGIAALQHLDDDLVWAVVKRLD